jgi:hypothetical protein
MSRQDSLVELKKYFPTDVCNIILSYSYYIQVPWKIELESKELTIYISQDSDYGFYFADLISFVRPKYSLRKNTLKQHIPRLNLWLVEYFEYSDDNFRNDFIIKTDCKPTLGYLCDYIPDKK